MNLDKAEQQWNELVEERTRWIIEDKDKTYCEWGIRFVESNLSQVPKVRELLEQINEIFDLKCPIHKGYMGIAQADAKVMKLKEALEKFNKENK